MAVMIGVDPHKGSHTAVALDDSERASPSSACGRRANQLERLLGWAAPFAERTWAIEGAGGLGYLLAQQLVAAGERVVDVQPKLAARVRLLATGRRNKNDPNDARSVAVAALRVDGPGGSRRGSRRGDEGVGEASPQPVAHRNRVACRLHAVLCDLVPGGIADEISPAQATRLLDELEPVRGGRRGPPRARRGAPRRPAPPRRASSPSASSGSPPRSTASKTTAHRALRRRPDRRRHRHRRHRRHRPLPDPRPLRRLQRHRPDRGVLGRTAQGVPALAARQPPPQPRHPHGRRHPDPLRHSPGRAYYDRKIAEGNTGKEALRALKRRISDALYIRLRRRRRRGLRRVDVDGPGRATGERLCRQRGRLTPRTPALRPSHSRTRPPPYDHQHTVAPPTPRPPASHPKNRLTTKRTRSGTFRCGGRPTRVSRRASPVPGGRVLVRLSCAGLGVHCAGYPSHQVPRRGGIIGTVTNVLGSAVEDATVRNIGCRSRTRFMQAVDRMAALEGFTFECPQVRPGGDPPLRTRGGCAAWPAGRQLSRGGGDRHRHRTPKRMARLTGNYRSGNKRHSRK